MPLTPQDRTLLRVIDRLKIYLLLIAFAIFLYLLVTPAEDVSRMVTAVIGITLCGVFWVMQQLLALISRLDFEFTRLTNALKRSLPRDQQREFFS